MVLWSNFTWWQTFGHRIFSGSKLTLQHNTSPVLLTRKRMARKIINPCGNMCQLSSYSTEKKTCFVLQISTLSQNGSIFGSFNDWASVAFFCIFEHFWGGRKIQKLCNESVLSCKNGGSFLLDCNQFRVNKWPKYLAFI